ncbi:hypothetical protein HDA42_006460 [Streptomyces costaricanus]|uniref:Uncharacterized protein n=1 Tax=Streptomyces murinus TaxID=33900 RepID=A0A7W3RPH9_STRMR|nr:hypothetical protein [Streptomyces murinus]
MDFEEVPGRFGGAPAQLGDDLGGHAVHGGAHARRDGVVDGGGDQRMHELQLAAPVFGGRGLGCGEDAGGAQQTGTVPGGVLVHGGEAGDRLQGDAGAEDGGGPGELGGLEAEFLDPVDESAAAGRAVEGAQFPGAGLHRRQFALLHLGEEFDGVVRIARGDGPDLAAERVVGVPTEGGAGESGRRVGGELAQVVDGAARGLGDRVEVPGALPADVAGSAGDHDQDGQVVQAFGEGGEPAQGLLVGPVRVVDQQHERPFAAGEPADGGHESVAHVLRVGALLLRFGYAEGGTGDVVPVAEVLAGLLGQQRQQRGLEQLPYHVEGHGPQGLGAAGVPDGAAPAFGHPAGLGQQRGLAEARLAAEDQQAARGGLVGAQLLDGPRDGVDLRVPLPQGSRSGRRRPSLRHPVTSPRSPE